MFRTQQNAFDDVVAKATDENLTSENWEFMMDAWEKVNSAGESGPKEAVAALIKRLAHRNANVQLYTLELANAFTQNCGPAMNRELASRAFTDALLRLASDRNTHQAVKAKVLEKMAEWSELFSNNPDLGIMEQAFNRLKSQNPNLHPPSKPHKREITDVDRQKEEEELQMALAISLQERPNQAQASSSSHAQAGPSQQGTVQELPAQPAVTPHTTAATVSRVRALYDFIPSESGELAFRKGDIIAVLESVYKDWWKGSLRGQTGIFPLNYVEKLSDPTPAELEKDAQMESEVFGQIKNVEKLLALLSTSNTESNVQDNEEITALYHSTLAIRPKLIELIGKYSQKKDDFMALNEKFIKARRDYEALLETSMSHPAAHYGRPPSHTPYGYAGDYPPSGDPNRYYTPTPQHNPSASPPAGGAYPPPEQSGRHSANQYYPPQPDSHVPNAAGGAAPFYVVGQAPPGTQLPGQAGRTPSAPPTGNAPLPHQHPQQSQRPLATGAPPDGPQPQELSTPMYDTPVTAKPPGQDRPLSPSQPPGQPQYGTYQPYNAQQRPVSMNAASQRPHYDPANTAGAGPSPISPANDTSAPSAPYPSTQQRPHSYYPGDPSTRPQPNGQDYYRQNELFLPPGSRAQG